MLSPAQPFDCGIATCTCYVFSGVSVVAGIGVGVGTEEVTGREVARPLLVEGKEIDMAETLTGPAEGGLEGILGAHYLEFHACPFPL